MKKLRVLIIGDGIAGSCIRYTLAKLSGLDITQVSSHNHFPACSLNSTAINCLRGTQRGVSKLGDEIVDSYDYFLKFISEEKPEGIFKGSEVQFFSQKENWERRYSNFREVGNSLFSKWIDDLPFFYESDAYFFDFKQFQKWVEEKSPNIVKNMGLVKNIKKNGEVIIENQNCQFDLVILATNYGTKFLSYGLNEDYDYKINHSKSVAGSYLEIDAKKLNLSFPHSTNFALEKYHFIYRKEQGLIQIGATSDNNSEVFLPNKKELQSIYDNVKKNLKFDLPPFKDFNQLVGIRHKGYKRMPFHDFITNHVFAISGLYKNGFLLSFKIAQDLSTALVQRLDK